MSGDEDENENVWDKFDIELAERVSIAAGISDEVELPWMFEGDDPENKATEFAIMRLHMELHREKDLIDDTSVDQSTLHDSIEEARKIQRLNQYFIPLVNFSFQQIVRLTIELLESELITDEYRGTNSTETLLARRFDQKIREDLLLRTGIISPDLKSEMTHARKLRNDLMHNPSSSALLENVDDVISEGDRLAKLQENLIEVIPNKEKFEFVVDMEG